MSTLHLIVRHFADVSPAEELRLLALLTHADIEGIAKYPITRKNQQLARAWRREILAQALHVWPAQLIFEKAAHGKPYLANQKISFNTSHCDEAFAMVWSVDNIQLGIDIEDKNKIRKEQALAARTFSAMEMKAWQNPDFSPHQAHEQWLTTWTRKEAVLKAHGLGIRLDLNSLNTENADDTLKHSLLGEWHYRSFNMDEQMVSVASQSQSDEIEIVL